MSPVIINERVNCFEQETDEWKMMTLSSQRHSEEASSTLDGFCSVVDSFLVKSLVVLEHV
jgi:hypothetical protein